MKLSPGCWFQGGNSDKESIMSDQDVIDLFDSNLNMTLRELSHISGRTVKNLKKLLMGES